MIVFITGANRGLGLSLCEVFLERGHQVLAGVRNMNRAGQLLPLKTKYKEELSIIPVDVSSQDSIRQAYSLITAVTPKLDAIINNAAREGIRCKKIQEVDIADFEETWKTNVLGPMAIIKSLKPMMESSSVKSILNISSEAGSISELPLKTYGYCISKAALNMFTRMLERELKPENFKVVAVHPGWMKTEMGGEDAPYEPGEIARHLYERLTESPGKKADFNIVDHLGNRMPP
ncbi:SDR family oxidoreductase [Paenibacillus chitinolyticus]|uniref:Possible dehydrogenase n=1 Tax=Niallia circulans TaxID=1397 RepID=Q4H4F1_NIACI|nr:SDR family oxidoreductase [Paenibacillus chitinolyticus]MEC0244348.1 SDR family oxidoreductase [Paenibacillus chitinolyticus]BAE07070.1 possible dehydrogenase [Niallia circulans]CAG77424.1 putative oxidoreductase [Niallia circulans]